jgi:hypothetical protein
MATENIGITGTLVFLLFPVVYVIGKRICEKAAARTRVISDEEYLLHLARMRKCSEYDIFQTAGESWHISKPDILIGFKAYLIRGVLPHYVRDYVRKNKLAREDLEHLIFNSGGIFTPSWENSSEK